MLPPAVPPTALPASGTPAFTNDSLGASEGAAFTPDNGSLAMPVFGFCGTSVAGMGALSQAAKSNVAYASTPIALNRFVNLAP